MTASSWSAAGAKAIALEAAVAADAPIVSLFLGVLAMPLQADECAVNFASLFVLDEPHFAIEWVKVMGNGDLCQGQRLGWGVVLSTGHHLYQPVSQFLDFVTASKLDGCCIGRAYK
jgi:hypothetical protein